MCRSATIHGRSASGSIEWRARRRGWQRRVDRLELARDVGEVLPLGFGAGASAFALAAARRPRRAARSQRRRAPAAARRRADARSRSPAACASSVTRRRPSTPGTKIAALFSSAAREAPSRAVRTRTRPARSRGIAGRPISGRVRSRTTSQPGSSRSARSTPRATTRSFGRSSTTIVLLLRRGEKSVVSTPGETSAVVAGEPLLGRGANGLVQRDQRVEPAEQLLALRAGGRIAEPVRRGERGDRERVGVAEREVGERRQPGLEAVHDVELRPARARAPGSPGRRPARPSASGARSGSPARPRSRRRCSPRVERAAPGEQVGRPRRRAPAPSPRARGRAEPPRDARRRAR